MNQHLMEHIPRVKEFFLGRQPILCNKEQLFGYELLFRRAAAGAANVVDDLEATASVISHASELGIANVIGNAFGFFNVDAAVLMADVVDFLPADRVVLEILETVEIDQPLLDRIDLLVKRGYRFALDDVVASDADNLKQLLPLIDIIKIDITDMQEADLCVLYQELRKTGKLLLAEKVETIQQFELCKRLGFDYFQGYYFAKPVVLSGKKLAPSQMTIIQLLATILRDADSAELEALIKQDISIGLNLLRLVNSPGVGAAQRIDSLGQALTVLGRRQLQRWLQIVLYAEPSRGNDFRSPLLQMATTRGKLLELIAEKLEPGNRAVADTAFTVGIMSLMDTLFAQPMQDILRQMVVIDEVSDALLRRRGFYGELLKLAEYIERIDEAGSLLAPTVNKLHLSTEDLYSLQLEAFEWSDGVAGGGNN